MSNSSSSSRPRRLSLRRIMNVQLTLPVIRVIKPNSASFWFPSDNVEYVKCFLENAAHRPQKASHPPPPESGTRQPFIIHQHRFSAASPTTEASENGSGSRRGRRLRLRDSARSRGTSLPLSHRRSRGRVAAFNARGSSASTPTSDGSESRRGRRLHQGDLSL